jgi:hypothetical protein
MEHGEEFRIYMKAANRDQSNQNDPHLSEARMIAYYRGELSETEREVTQVHLVGCAKCIALFRSLGDFLEPANADEEDITAAETNQQWQSFLQRVKISSQENVTKPVASVVQGDFKASRDKKVLLNSRPTLALAASLVISLGTAGWLAWSFWQERQSRRQSQQMAAQSASKQRELEQRLAQLTESGADEIKREREQRLAAEAERDKLQDLLAAAQPRSDDTRIYPFTLSSDRGATEELQLKLNSPAEVRLLISKPGAFDQYEVAILDEGGRSVRKFQGLRPRGVDRALSFRLNRGALSPGKYRLRLLGQQGSTSTQIGEYSLMVTGPG